MLCGKIEVFHQAKFTRNGKNYLGFSQFCKRHNHLRIAL